MRLWHYQLIPYLPNSQLIAQWRELNSIFKNQPKHILINYVYEYDKRNLSVYTEMVIKEMEKRGFKINNLENCKNYLGPFFRNHNWTTFKPFKNNHNDIYLTECYYNLKEKYERGQKDFSEDQFMKLQKFYVPKHCSLYMSTSKFPKVGEKNSGFKRRLLNACQIDSEKLNEISSFVKKEYEEAKQNVIEIALLNTRTEKDEIKYAKASAKFEILNQLEAMLKEIEV